MGKDLAPRRPPPPVPVQYENACKAIAICTKINDAWQWANKSDALAAWAKIYGDDKIDREARLLKLHAFRRMGQLAREINGAHPQPVLKGEGLKDGPAFQAVVLGDMKEKKFATFTKRDRVPSPGTIVHVEISACPEWMRLQRAMGVCKAICGHHTPKNMMVKMTPKQIARARVLIIEIREWMRQFEEALS